jgi:hypothetical protein
MYITLQRSFNIVFADVCRTCCSTYHVRDFDLLVLPREPYKSFSRSFVHDEVGFVYEQKSVPEITLYIALNSFLFFSSILSPPSYPPCHPPYQYAGVFLLAKVLRGMYQVDDLEVHPHGATVSCYI